MAASSTPAVLATASSSPLKPSALSAPASAATADALEARRVARLTTGPSWGRATTRTVSTADPLSPGRSEPRLQRTTRPATSAPRAARTTSSPAGRVSSSTTWRAETTAELLVQVSRYSAVCPMRTVSDTSCLVSAIWARTSCVSTTGELAPIGGVSGRRSTLMVAELRTGSVPASAPTTARKEMPPAAPGAMAPTRTRTSCRPPAMRSTEPASPSAASVSAAPFSAREPGTAFRTAARVSVTSATPEAASPPLA
jgi:hypothetical protein